MKNVVLLAISLVSPLTSHLFHTSLFLKVTHPFHSLAVLDLNHKNTCYISTSVRELLIGVICRLSVFTESVFQSPHRNIAHLSFLG